VSIDLKTGAPRKVSSLNVPSVYGVVGTGEDNGCRGE